MFQNQNEGDIQPLERKIQDCDDKMASLEQKRAGIKQQDESEHSAYLEMKATDGAIKPSGEKGSVMKKPSEDYCWAAPTVPQKNDQ